MIHSPTSTLHPATVRFRFASTREAYEEDMKPCARPWPLTMKVEYKFWNKFRRDVRSRYIKLLYIIVRFLNIVMYVAQYSSTFRSVESRELRRTCLCTVCSLCCTDVLQLCLQYSTYSKTLQLEQKASRFRENLRRHESLRGSF